MPDFRSFDKIDAHIHYNTNRTTLLEQAEEDHYQLVSINTDVPFFPELPEQEQFTLDLENEHALGNRLHHLGTFPVDEFNDVSWTLDTIEFIQQRLKNSALGIKVWKNIGMSLEDQYGNMVMIDDPKFDPIFDYMERNEVTVLGHLGEPRNCWLPVEEMTVEGDRNYFSNHPQYHMYKHPEFPSYEDQINARDRRLEKHPDLRFVGAHLASLEWDTDEIAKRLDRFPNMAVDLAERICHLQHQAVTNPQKVKDFVMNYQDRIIYGTDVIDDGSMDPDEMKQHIHKRWSDHWKYFTTSKMMTAEKVTGAFEGLELPEEVLHKIYYQNAINWYPGLTQE